MIKVLHVHFRLTPAKKEIPTADRHISNALAKYSKHNHDIMVEEDLGEFGWIAYKKLSEFFNKLRKKLEKHTYHLSKAPTIIFSLFICPFLAIPLYKRFKNYDIVVLHGHRVIVFIGSLGGVLLIRLRNALTNKKTKIIFHAHNSYSAIFPILRRLYFSFSNLLMDGLIFMTEDDMKKCQNLVKIPAFVLYNPVPEDLLNEKPKPENKRTIDFLFVSRYSKHKRHDLILRAIEKVNIPKRKTVHIRLIGSIQDNYQKVKTLAENIKKPGLKIEVLANVPWKVIKESYENAKWFIFPSTEREGFPIVLLEAMAHGVPIICSDYPMYREIGNNCFIYFKDEKELANIITDILHNTISWKEWSKKSRQLTKKYSPKNIAYKFDKKINRMFSKEHVVKEIEKIYGGSK